jgi:hypothetical protein
LKNTHSSLPLAGICFFSSIRTKKGAQPPPAAELEKSRHEKNIRHTKRAVSPQMGVIAGDTNGDSSVDSTDVSQTKSQSGNSAAGGGSGFREDINLDGFVDGTDVSFVKSKSGGHLP